MKGETSNIVIVVTVLALIICTSLVQDVSGETAGRCTTKRCYYTKCCKGLHCNNHYSCAQGDDVKIVLSYLKNVFIDGEKW